MVLVAFYVRFHAFCSGKFFIKVQISSVLLVCILSGICLHFCWNASLFFLSGLKASLV